MPGPARGTIALDITPALRQGAGVGRYARELAGALVTRGAYPYVLFAADRPAASVGTPATGSGVPDLPGVRYSGLAARWHAILWYRLGLPLSPERWTGPVRAYHSMDYLAPPLGHGRVVVTVHDLSFLVHPERAEPSLARFLTRQVPRSVRRAAHVLADSEHTRQDLITRLALPAEQVTVAYPGIGGAFRRVTDPQRLEGVRARHALRGPFVLGVGTLEPRKDWPVLIAAWQRLAVTVPGHQLVLAGGPGWQSGPILAAIAAAGDRVRWLGFVPDDDLPGLYSLADAVAYPSIYEGFGLPPLEAMACGTPTVVAAASCLPEVVGEAALLAPVGDAAGLAAVLAQVLGDADLRADLAARGPRHAAAFTWDRCAAAVEQVFGQL